MEKELGTCSNCALVKPLLCLGSGSTTCCHVTRTAWDSRTRLPAPLCGHERRLLVPRPIRAEDARCGRTEKLLRPAQDQHGHWFSSLQRCTFQSLVLVCWEHSGAARVQRRGGKSRLLSAVSVPGFQSGHQLHHAPLQPGARRRPLQRQLGHRAEVQGGQLGVWKRTSEQTAKNPFSHQVWRSVGAGRERRRGDQGGGNFTRWKISQVQHWDREGVFQDGL